MNLTDFLLMKNGNTVKPDADLFDILLAKKLSGGAGVITTLTGNPLNFLVKKAQTAISTKISMSPIQEGTGDPSPTNIRPISGRSSVEINGCGKNLFFSVIYGASVNSSGVIVINGTYSLAVAEVQKGQRYLNSIDGSAEVAIRGYFSEIPQKGSVTYDGSRYTSANSFTSPIDGYVCVRIPISETKYQLELSPVGTTASPYEAYQSSNDVTISFGETVYGGTLDVETGELVVNMGYVDMGNISWQKASCASSPSGYIFRSATAYTISRSTEILSSIYKTGNWQYTSQVKNNGICANSSGQILVRNDTYDNDVKAFTTAMSGVQLVYELATPRTIQLTPSEVQLLKGVNNLWTDGDEIELTYKA